MTEREAALTSMHEYKLRLEGHERAERLKWELARWEIWQLMMPHFKKGLAPKTAQQFCRFPWEKGSITNEQQAREMLERSRVTENEARILDEFFAKLNEKQNKH